MTIKSYVFTVLSRFEGESGNLIRFEYNLPVNIFYLYAFKIRSKIFSRKK